MIARLSLAHRALSLLALLSAPAVASPGFTALEPTSAGDCIDDVFEDNDDCSSAVPLAAGSYSSLVATDTDYDYYLVSVPDGHRLTFEVLSESDAFVSLHEGGTVDCFQTAGLVSAWLGAEFPQQFHWANLSGQTLDYIIGFQPFSDCARYELEVVIERDACGALSDDGFAGNQDCASAISIGVGRYPGQMVSAGNSDHFTVDVQPGEWFRLDVASPFNGSSFPVRPLMDPTCNTPVGAEAISSFNQDGYRLHLFNRTNQVQSYPVRLDMQPSPTDPLGFCSEYDLEISKVFNPAGIFEGDAFEANDSCDTRMPIDDGLFDLSASMLNQDWFSISVEAGATLSYTVTSGNGFPWSSHLREDCSGHFQAVLALAQPVAGQPNRSRLSWTNEGTTPMDANFFVIHPFNVSDYASTYQLDLRNTQGEVFCSSEANSSGAAARIDASGSTDSNAGTLELSAVNVPANNFGLFFYSPNEISAVPFGNGVRCLGAPFRRLPVSNAGPNGVLQTTIDWSNPGNASVINSGTTWSFQAWFRDATGGGAGYDLSDGLRIEFQ